MREFRDTYLRYKDNIAVTALSQRIAGLDYDDVVSEMTICLWRAWESWDPTHEVPFGTYWWSLWLNRKTDMIRQHQAMKRPKMILLDDYELAERLFYDQSYELNLPPQPPKWCTGEEQVVWELLAAGESVKQTIIDAGISKRSYYDLIHRLRTDEVREELDG